MAQPGRPRRVLFVCQWNRSRSATAERLFCRRKDLEVRSAGTSPDALVRVNERMLDWADVIFTMDEGQREEMAAMFPTHAALERLVCLDIPDDFTFLQPALVDLLERKVATHLG
ncbi:MAG: hypothetical protein A3H96_12785 [Acidobacteria bacterium RIFCSPLOWO2_02_FULL_67_36]|nr:MAG: hypothetical protein A3H96_12785 [Acidobacteria bacterium RIFCSPLOWO2_02_FULL_67_36]OFW23500.1 MAG: hypothetical protein A3G21_06095 [Acidobacteria bacterium RIFCSPLOWO2_12_FULL_66_21]